MPTGIYPRIKKRGGWKFREETKEKIRMAKLGKKLPPFSGEHRRRMSESHKGTKSHFWKGGIYPLRFAIRKTFEYRQWRSDVFTRDEFTCQKCGAKNGNGKTIPLRAHHIKEFSEILEEYQIKTMDEALNCEELWNINNGITLCEECHKQY